MEKTNTAQKGKISVQKTGNVFASVTALGSAIYIDENGEVHESGQTAYTPVFAKENLSGAVFQVIASEDIITADGTIRANAGDVVAELVTDENGYAETDLLYLGKYEVKEITAPDGYVLNAESQFVELTYAGQEIAVRDTVWHSFEIELSGREIYFFLRLWKMMKSSEFQRKKVTKMFVSDCLPQRILLPLTVGNSCRRSDCGGFAERGYDGCNCRKNSVRQVLCSGNCNR